MRIAYVCADPGVPVFGCKGCSIHVQEVIRALSRRGASVELFAAATGGTPPADLVGVPCFAMPPLPKADAVARERSALAANEALRGLLRERPAFDAVYERYSLWSHAGMTHARDAGVPGLLEVNAPLIEEQARHRGLTDRAAAEAVARTVFAAAGALLPVSTGVAAYLARFGVDPDRIHVTPNGVDVSRFSPRSETGRADFVVGFVGTLKPWHGLSTLVRAAAIARGRGMPLRLLIVGDGPERGALAADLADSGLAEVSETTGAVSPAEIPGLLARMDVAAAPYPALPDFYFSPLKVLEYMGAGCAIAASRIGDIDGLIEDGVTGLLCPPGDAAALADALLRLHAEPLTRVRLGRAARETAARDFGWGRVADRILALAREEVRPKARRAAPC